MASSRQSRVIVGMSGGVDSAVSAMLLVEQGLDVQGLFMKNWQDDEASVWECPASQDLEDAKRVCDDLQIPLHSVNFSARYRDRVFGYFLREYQAGRTPNPDILCNKEIKFRAFLDHALDRGADFIATGHYARTNTNASGHLELWKGVDAAKDQSYFLHTLDQKQLASSIFPIGSMEKRAVRELARDRGLHNHARKDSTGICFIGERDFREFLSRHLPTQPGEIHTVDGEAIGVHMGLAFYTLGQRQGLGIGGASSGNGRPWYVVDKDLRRNVLQVVQGADHPALCSHSLSATDVHWIGGEMPKQPLAAWAKVRYRQQEQACRVTPLGGARLAVEFEEPQRAVTPGQSVVFYLGDRCLGGAVIDCTYNEHNVDSMGAQRCNLHV